MRKAKNNKAKKVKNVKREKELKEHFNENAEFVALEEIKKKQKKLCINCKNLNL